MIDAVVAGEALPDVAVGIGFVGHQGALGVRMSEDQRTQIARLNAIDMERPGAAAALNQRQDGAAITIAAFLLPAITAVKLPGRAVLFVTDEGFVDFQGLAFTAHRPEYICIGAIASRSRCVINHAVL